MIRISPHTPPITKVNHFNRFSKEKQAVPNNMEADLNQRRPFRAEQDQEAVGLEDVPHPPLPNDDSSSTEANPNADAYDPYLTEEQKQNKEEEEKKRNSQDLICRICFEGRSEDELGKLFSPCKCRGTMKVSEWIS